MRPIIPIGEWLYCNVVVTSQYLAIWLTAKGHSLKPLFYVWESDTRLRDLLKRQLVTSRVTNHNLNFEAKWNHFTMLMAGYDLWKNESFLDWL